MEEDAFDISLYRDKDILILVFSHPTHDKALAVPLTLSETLQVRHLLDEGLNALSRWYQGTDKESLFDLENPQKSEPPE